MSNQIDLFSGMPQPSAAPHTVNEARDDAMARVQAAAERHRRWFSDEAERFMVRYLMTHGPTSGEKLTVECKAAGISPHDDRAFGPVYMRLCREGVIEKVGTVRRERGHGTSGGNVWALVRTSGSAR